MPAHCSEKHVRDGLLTTRQLDANKRADQLAKRGAALGADSLSDVELLEGVEGYYDQIKEVARFSCQGCQCLSTHKLWDARGLHPRWS